MEAPIVQMPIATKPKSRLIEPHDGRWSNGTGPSWDALAVDMRCRGGEPVRPIAEIEFVEMTSFALVILQIVRDEECCLCLGLGHY